MEFPQKTRIAIWSSNLPVGYIPRQNYNLKRYTHPYVRCSTVHDSQDMETTWTSISRCGDEEDLVPVHHGTQPSKKGNDAMFSDVAGLETTILHDSWKKTSTIWYHSYVDSKIWHKWGGGKESDWEFRISRCKLLYTGWINKVLLYIAQGTIFHSLW